MKAGRGRVAKAAVREKTGVEKKAPAKAAKAVKKAAKPAAKPKKDTRKVARDLRIERFVAEYLIDYNGRRAATEAGYSAESARMIAYQLLQQPDVQALIQARQAEIAKQLGITQEIVVARLQAMATADPRELTELHRGCCRYCWGKGHRYQYTPQELRDAKDEWQVAETERQAKNVAPIKFSEQGGLGFNAKKDPNPKCPECCGDGEERVVFKDTRDLSPMAMLLYAGVEQTQHGKKMRTNSQADALINLGKHLGMFGTKKVELTGPNGGPVQHTAVDAILALIDGSDVGVGPAASRK